MRDWISMLVHHYENMRILHPGEDLMVLLDADGTILDLRAMVLYVLKDFDRVHHTPFFSGLTRDEIPEGIPDMEDILGALDVPHGIGRRVAVWYNECMWSPDAVSYASRAFSRVMGFVRCLQIQPGVHIGLAINQPLALRQAVVEGLGELGGMYHVEFSSDAVFVDDTCPDDAALRMVRACSYYRARGFRILAVVDSAPEHDFCDTPVIETRGETLCLHADSVSAMRKVDIPLRALCGNGFDIGNLIGAQCC